MHAMLSMSSVFELQSRALEILSVLAENTGGELKYTVLLSHFQISYGKKLFSLGGKYRRRTEMYCPSLSLPDSLWQKV